MKAPGRNHSITVIKIGGGLTSIPAALGRVCAAVAAASGTHRLVVVPGGGPFADAVRELDHQVGLSADAAHWMAILAMDQYAHVLAARIPGAVLVEEPGGILAAVDSGQVAVLAPTRWMRSADVLPHSWDVTSDSVAAFVAGALDASRLILVKPTDQADGLDPYFTTALPVGLSWVVLGSNRIEELPQWLSG